MKEYDNKKLNYYTIWYIPYPGWGVWKDELIMTEKQFQEFKERKPELVKVIKHRKLPFTPDYQERH